MDTCRTQRLETFDLSFDVVGLNVKMNPRSIADLLNHELHTGDRLAEIRMRGTEDAARR